MKEFWVPVYGHSGYEISTFGRVRSVDRLILKSNNRTQKNKGKILLQCISSNDYFCVTLDNVTGTLVHILMAISFANRGRKPGLDIDHIDGNKLNNRIDNLQFLERRANSIKERLKKKGYVGVFYYASNKRWYGALNGKRTKACISKDIALLEYNLLCKDLNVPNYNNTPIKGDLLINYL